MSSTKSLFRLTRRRIAVAILLIAVGIGWLVWSSRAPESGIVVDRKHEKARDYIAFLPVQAGSTCSSNGKTSTCTPIYTQIPYMVHDDEDWRLRLRDGDKEGWVRVSESDYKSHADGSFFDGALANERNRKERQD